MQYISRTDRTGLFFPAMIAASLDAVLFAIMSRLADEMTTIARFRSSMPQAYEVKTFPQRARLAWGATNASDIAKQFVDPVPATKILQDIKYLEPDVNRRVFACAVYINATST